MGSITTVDKKWWKSGVVYQIYPSSFNDSNGDGIGDIPGIIEKLDYIKDLGADIVWLSPMYDSPQIDMGYDISDYEAIYPPYGTLQDMERLIQECHARGMKMMLDLVINHTSDMHAWFKESRSSKTNPKRDWYVWRPARYDADGQRRPPNNWRSNFGGGSAWEWDPVTEEYYLHLFAKEQPDVNWENPETRKALYASSMEFWLDRGVDGFRIDTVNMYSKPEGYPDAPTLDDASDWQPAYSLYCNGPRMHEYLGEMNEILSRYGAITVGELPHTPDTAKVLKYVSAKAKQLDMVFQFDVCDVGFGTTHKFATVPRSWTLPDFKAAVERTQVLIKGTDAWTTVFIENHDQARSISRFACDSPAQRVASGKLLAVLETTLSGTLFVYQGQEIGMVNAPAESYPVTEYRDIESLGFYDLIASRTGNDPTALASAFAAMQHLARDHARIPVSWDGKLPNAGFSTADRSWMKPHPRSGEVNVASQVGDDKSVLAFWKKMLRFRKEHEDGLVYGEFDLLSADDPDLFTYNKTAHDGRRYVVVLNFAGMKKVWRSEQSARMLLSTVEGKEDGDLLSAYEGRVYVLDA
ncbi:glycoside hydrolase superfamily [Coniochaeta sp. 2T2.1]|nr:glycoside hydrolase superfamily [Coniochaeta sp. 2T2.1]